MVDDDLLAQKAEIEAEIRKRQCANKRAQKDMEDQMLIAAAEGKRLQVRYVFDKLRLKTCTGPRKAKEKELKDASE